MVGREVAQVKLLVERQDAVTVLTLNRPEGHDNVDDEPACELADAIDAFGADPGPTVLVVTGAGDRTFCAGATLTGMKELFEHRRTGAEIMGLAQEVVPAVAPEAMAGMVRFAEGARDEPPRYRS